MATYQLNCLSEGRAFRCEVFESASDEEAIRRSIRLRGITAAELWCGARQVTTFEQIVREPV